MTVTVKVKRQASPDSAPYVQTFLYAYDSAETTVATLLREVNETAVRDIGGKPVGEITWECSCLQKKCGACAMVINGTPRLACDTKLSDLRAKTIVLEPLKKFPVVRDLMVDRSVMRSNLLAIHNWLEQDARQSGKTIPLAYDASRCIQCGCCLEVCPQFAPDNGFYGAAAFVPASRVLAALAKGDAQDILSDYRKYIYSGCGKSLACHNICPVGIDVESKLSNSNAVAVWKRFFHS